MRVPYAWLDLVHDRGRTMIAALGVAFAVLLILMQLGFYGSVGRTAVLIPENMLFDVLLCSRHYRFVTSPGTMPTTRLHQARGVAGVDGVTPLDLSFVTWRTAGEGRRQTRAITVLGIDPTDCALDLDRIGASAAAIDEPDSVLIDRKSRPEFGPQTAGTQAEAGAQEVTIAGTFEMGTGFGADGAILVNRRTFRRLLPAIPEDVVSFGLVRAAAGVAMEDLASRLRERLPNDVRIFTREDLVRAERHHWIVKTSVGVIFGMGVLTSLVVGMAIVSQVLGNKVAHHFKEFATMKALGYPQRYISGTVIMQATAIAVMGYLPGLLVASVGYDFTTRLAHIPMRLGASEAATVFVLAVGMCVAAASTALRKVARAAPADLF
jgi:putative ABC transport system permease protein